MLLIELCEIPVMLLNELAFLPLVINHVLLMLLCFFEPLWRKQRLGSSSKLFDITTKDSGWTIGHPPSMYWACLEVVMMLTQAVFIPIVLIVQLFLPILPIVVLGISLLLNF